MQSPPSSPLSPLTSLPSSPPGSPLAPAESETRNTLRILSCNLNKSHKALSHTVLQAAENDIDVLAIQEPWWTGPSATLTANNAWTHVIPPTHTPDSRARAVILVNKSIPTDKWEPLAGTGGDFIGVRIWTADGQSVVIYNIYDDQTGSTGLLELEREMDTEERDDHIIWLGDFNAHHGAWEPDGNETLYANGTGRARGERLIQLVADYGMLTALPPGIGTFITRRTANSPPKRTRPDGVFASPSLEDCLIDCDTREDWLAPAADHLPILTELDLAAVHTNPEDKFNWYAVEWPKFLAFLREQLANGPQPATLNTLQAFNAACDHIYAAIYATMDKHVPKSRPSPRHKRWWTPELKKMRRKCARIGEKAKRFRHAPEHEIHRRHAEALDAYGKAMEQAKSAHFEDFLESVDSHSIWLAHKMLCDVPMSVGGTRVPTLVQKDANGNITSTAKSNDEKSETLYASFFPQKPANLDLPPIDPRLRNLEGMRPPTREQIRRNVDKLAPYKAPGEDKIPNVVIKRCIDLLIEYLFHIYGAVAQHGFYYERWRLFITVVIRKPGRGTYTVAKSFRPVALYNSFSKLDSSCAAEDICYLAEKLNLLPPTHFGGRPRRTTTDSLQLLTKTIKDAWRNKNVVSVLFLDTAGAFPNAVPERLYYNMRKSGVPEGYVRFVENMLTGRRTCIKFDDYTSSWFDVDNGIGQGDPLSMILYLFYNADMVKLADGRDELSLGYVDDLALVAIGPDFTHTHATLRDMMLRPGGGCSFAASHNSPWEFDKTHVVDFATPARDGILNYEQRDIVIGGNTITNATSFKFLGVHLDRHLNFKKHAAQATAKGARYVAQIRRIARTTKGIKGEYVRRLYVAVAVPKMCYAADVWFTPIRNDIKGRRGGSRAFAKQLASVQRAAAILITGAMRTSPGDLLDLHADLWPIPLLLDKFCFRATLRLCTLDDAHPLFPHIRRAHRHRSIKTHPAPIHLLFDAYKSLQPTDLETIPTYHHDTKWTRTFQDNIAADKPAAIRQDKEDFNNTKYSVYTDGSAIDNQVGAAAVLFVDRKIVKTLYFHLGSTVDFGNYEAEAIGLWLGAHLLQAARSGPARLASDSQPVLKATRFSKPRSAHWILAGMHRSLAAQDVTRLARGRERTLTFVWVPGHKGIVGNEAADKAAKAAARGRSSLGYELPLELAGLDVHHLLRRLPASASARRRAHTEGLQQQWTALFRKSTRYARYRRVDTINSPAQLRKLLLLLPRAHASIITQLRLGHAPLNRHLHRIKRHPHPTCDACGRAPESVRHFLLECSAYRAPRERMLRSLGRGFDRLESLLSTQAGIKAVIRYTATTGRFKDSHDLARVQRNPTINPPASADPRAALEPRLPAPPSA